MTRELLAVGGGSTPVGIYIAALLTAVTLAGGYGFKKLIDRLSSLGEKQGEQSNGLAVLVERVVPVQQQLGLHDRAIGELRESHGRLSGRMDSLVDMVKRDREDSRT